MRVSRESSERVDAVRHPVRWWPWVAAALVLVSVMVTVRTAATRAAAGRATADAPDKPEPMAGTTTHFTVTIRKPSGPPRVDTGLTDTHGDRITASCTTCHATRTPNPQSVSAKDLDEFHGELTFSHGTITCLSCHNPSDYDALKLADGRRVEFSDVMTLCAQCHGPQMQAYKHGAHGGMTGHWDLTRGPRTRINCVDCHDPHKPQFPAMKPTFKPYDRFLEPARTKH